MPLTLATSNIPRHVVTWEFLYDQEVLRLIDKFNELGIFVGSVVITQYAGQPAADAFRNQLEKNGIDSYLHYPIKGYPTDMDHIISPEGMGKNDYIKTSRNLIVVTAPGPGSGKIGNLYVKYVP